MKFFEDNHGRLYPVARIASISRGKWIKETTRREDGKIDLIGGDEFDAITVDDDQINRLVGAGSPVIPAAPGYTLLGYWDQSDAEEEAFVEQDPIIGWRIDGTDTPTPIVAQFDFDGITGIHAVLRPDGSVVDLFGSTFQDRASWETDMRKRATKTGGA
jgi:hypothetical protein